MNISAPGDNVSALYRYAPTYDGYGSDIIGGTSAAAPEVAAAAAVALQVARLTGHPYATPSAVRDALVATGTPVANPPQLDVTANIGPQVSVRRVVEQLLAAAGKAVQPGIARVAVHGRRSGQYFAQVHDTLFDGTYVTALDPAFIKLDGPFTTLDPGAPAIFHGTDSAADLNSYVTFAPDWEAIPANATYRLTVAGQPGRVIATTPRVRMLPAQLFAAAGVPMTPGVSKTVSLTYTASVGLHAIAESTFQLTFGPPAAASRLVLAPTAPPVVTGQTIPVTYDVRMYPASLASNPTLNVSLPGQGTMPTDKSFVPLYSTPLPSTHGTINVPVSALAGAGTYMIYIAMQSALPWPEFSDPAFTRVDAGTARPPAPLLSSAPGQPTWHSLVVSYKSTFAVTYDVSNVPRATGAIVELSAPPPGLSFANAPNWSGWHTFRNPNGNQLDDDGVITGSIYHVPVSGTSGTVMIDPTVAGIPPTSSTNVRVLPTNGITPIAEASDADTLHYLGIEPILGGNIVNSFMNPNGTDGFLVEEVGIGPNGPLGTTVLPFEPFDLNGGVVTGSPLTFANTSSIWFPIVENDTAVAETAPDNLDMNFFRATPLEGAFSQFSLPPSFSPATWVWGVATNSSATRSAYLAADYTSGTISVFAGDVTTGSFSQPVDLTTILGPNVDVEALVDLAYDPSTDRAYIVNEDATLPCSSQSPQLVTIDFGTGTASARSLPMGGGTPGLGYNYQFAVDPATHVAAVATTCNASAGVPAGMFRSQLLLVDLVGGGTSLAFAHTLDYTGQSHGIPSMLGGDSPTIGIDPVNHLILQRSMFCPQLVSPADINARACLNEYDEHGTLVKTVPNLFNDGDFSTIFEGVNGTTRTGLAFGQEPPGFFINSYDVQPYSY